MKLNLLIISIAPSLAFLMWIYFKVSSVDAATINAI